jgi:hypothetical protein
MSRDFLSRPGPAEVVSLVFEACAATNDVLAAHSDVSLPAPRGTRLRRLSAFVFCITAQDSCFEDAPK